MAAEKFRTIQGAYQEIIRDDPDTAITLRAIRRAVTEGYVPSKRVGNKYVVAMSKLYAYFGGDEVE